MGAAKRKSITDDVAAISSKKRRKAGGDTPTSSKGGAEKQSEHTRSVTSRPKDSSVLTNELPAFPRGGASLLTPLERKQIQQKANRDVAAEQSSGGDLFGSKPSRFDDSDLEDASSEEEIESKRKEKAQKKATKEKRKRKSTEQKSSSIAIEGLSYKRLAVGSQILGQISSLSQTNITVALPNNLTGYVPLTEISAQFTSKLQNLLVENQDEEDQEGKNESDDEIALQDHFQVGQYIRVAVTSLGNEKAGAPLKRRIELSITPHQTNAGLSKSSLIVGATAQAAVSSIEDHGLVMDLGIAAGEDVKGFIPAKAMGSSYTLSSVRVGAVFLCQVVGIASSGKIIKLSPNLSKDTVLKNASTVEAFLPGTLVEVLLSEVADEGLAGKIMGMIDATADIVHSGSFRDREALLAKYKIGQRVKGRLLFTLPLSTDKKLGFSISSTLATIGLPEREASRGLQISSIIPSARVIRVSPGLGIYLTLPNGKIGFAHISRLSDKRVDSVSETLGAFKLGSEHKVRVTDYSSLDDLYILSLQRSIIEQPFLRIDDVPVGEVVKATVEKVIIGADGVSGLLLNLAEGVTGFVPPVHFSDITLLHPEKKFREGASLTARVLSVNEAKRQIRLTLKKTLLNSDQPAWSKFDDISVGDTTVGTLVKVDSHGALVQFFGDVKGFLPVSEMSEAYIKDAKEHFKVGQVLSVNCISINAEEHRLTVSCREHATTTQDAVTLVIPGTLVAGTIFEKSQNDLLLRLETSDVIARLTLDHVSDGSERKRRSNLEKLRVGQKLEDLVVLEVQRKGRLVTLSNKQTLSKAAQRGEFLRSFDDLREDIVLTGFVCNITEDGVFVRFAKGISGLVPKGYVPVESQDEPDFGLKNLQAVTARVMSVDYRGAHPRFWLTMREGAASKSATVDSSHAKQPADIPTISNPADSTITSFSDFETGKVTKARVTSIKDTQINVELAHNVQGRIDVSEVFDTWDDIKDRKQPLRIFSPRQVVDVRILGAHDSRNHRFLPLSHRSGKNTVFELSAKPSVIQARDIQHISLADMKIGLSWLAYVNNIAEDYLMVNISPSVRGRIKAIDVADDLNLAGNLEGNFPIGSAIRVKVIAVDEDKGRLDLTGKSSASSKALTLEDLAIGMILPGRVTRVSDRSILVQLSDNVVGAVELIDMADDYSMSDPARFEKNDVLRVAVMRVDIPNKKVMLSIRPSKVLSSSLKATDPEITSISQLKANDVVRGFISNVSEKGVFVTLGHGVTGFVRVTNLSDSYLKNWKEHFQRDQLVRAKVILVDADSGHIQLSLKESLMNADYKPPRTLSSTQVGDVVTGKVAKVETFGVFIVVDNSENVRGLCHRSEIAEQRVEDATKIFQEGDKVKAIVLKVDVSNRRINFGLKASYFADVDEVMDDSDGGAETFDDSDSMQSDGGVDAMDSNSDPEEMPDDDDTEDQPDPSTGKGVRDLVSGNVTGLSVGGFDWFGLPDSMKSARDAETTVSDDGDHKQKKRRKRAEIQVDRTGDLDANGPQSTDDFERLLLGEPDSSILWLQYMAFHLELGDIDQARQIGDRGLKTISLGQDAEKLNVWIALLNLENAYGDDESIEETFKRACEYNDPQDIYSHLTSIYIQSGKQDKADSLFQDGLKKFTQDPKLYVNYANFLFDTVGDADRGRALLSRALQVLPPFTHFDITSKFAQLEFKSDAGLAERGRTIFEGLINSFPKRIDLFNIMLDMEMQQLRTKEDKSSSDDDKEAEDQIRALFERIFTRHLKPKQAKYFFKRWLSFEEKYGDGRKVDEVKARAATWVKKSAGE